MIRRVIAVFACAAAMVVIAPARFSFAAAASPQLEIVSVDTSSPPEVKITLTVPRQLAGHQLGESNFTVIETGRRRLPTITRLPGDALAVVLAIDTSGSMLGAPIAAAKAAAVQFVDKMPAGTRVAVVGFADAPYVVSPFSTDTAALTSAINGVQAGGDTALYDGVVSAAKLMESAGTSRRAMVLLSDGGDSKSVATINAAETALTSADTSFYGAALLTSETDLPALNGLAASAGGRVVPASDPAGLGALYNDIATAITNQYQISFRPTHRGRTTVQVSVAADGVQAGTELTFDLASPARVATVQTHPVHITTPSAPLLGGASWALVAGGVLVFLALLGAALVLLTPRGRPSTLAVERRHSGPRVHDRALTDLVENAARLADRTLERGGRRSRLNDSLERAGIDMRPAEFVVLVVSVTLVVLFVGLLLFGPLVGLALGVVPVLVFRAGVARRAENRRNRFADQLGDTLQLMAGSLRSGHALLQAVDTVAEESESPTREEFHRIVVETRLGKSLPDALHAAAARVRNEDFDWIVQAIDIHREVGGDLAEVLDHVAGTIRSRNSIRRQVQALSAEGRLSAIILFVLPIGLAGLIAVVNPDYLRELTDSTEGQVLIAGGLVLLAVGGLWLRRLVRIVY